MRLSEKTPVLAVVFLVLAVAVGLGLWYMDVRKQVETQQALEQTRDAFERFERERKGPNEILTPAVPGAAAGAPAAAAPPAPATPQRRDSPPAASAAAPSREIYYLLTALLLTALVALALAVSSYRLVRRERRARMENQHIVRETVVERGPVFRASEGTIIDAETVETVSEARRDDGHEPPPAPRTGELLKTWIDESPLPVVAMRPSGEIEALNPAFTRLTGYAPTELPNVQAWLARAQRIPTDRQNAARNALRERYTGNTHPFETTIWTRAGEPLHWLMHTARYPMDEDEELWLLIGADITDRRRAEIAAVERAEQAHHDSEEVSSLYEHAPVGLAVLDSQLRFVRVNEALARMSGLAAKDHLGKPLRKLLPHVASAAEPLLTAALQGQATAGSHWITVRTPANPKTDAHWAVHCSPLRDAGGRIARVALAAEDVTEAGAAQAELRTSESAMRALFEHLPAAVCVKDAQGRYVYANPAYGELVQVSRERLKGRMDHEVLPWEAADRLRDTDEEALAGRKAVSSQGTLALGESSVDYAASKVALRDGADKAYAVCAIYADATAQQRVERDVRAAEARYRAIFESSPVPMFIDSDNHLVQVNAACVQLLAARDEQQLLGKSILEFIEQPAQQRFQERIQRVLRRKSAGAPLEATVRRLDGTPVEAEIDMALYQTAGERAVQIVVRDVTERKHAEKALRESEATLKRLAEDTPALVRLANAEGETIYCNGQWQRLTGLAAAEALGQRWLEHVHPDDQGMLAGALDALRSHRGPTPLEYRLRSGGNGYRWMLDILAPRVDEAGAYLGYVACAVDIDVRKRVEGEMRRDLKRYSAVADAAPAMLWTESAQGIELVNAALRAELGVADGEDWGERIHAEDRERYATQRAQAAESGRAVTVAVRVQNAHGDFRDMIATLAPGAPGALVGTLTDVTDVQRAQRAAADADARRNAFIAALAADMRAPLAPLRHAAEVLRLSARADRELQEASDIVVRNAQYLARLLDDAQDASRLLSDTLQVTPSETDLGELAHRAIAAARPLMEARAIRLEIALASGRAPVHVDGERVTQALTRLLDHCAQQAEPGGTIAVSAQEDEAEGALHVTVNGVTAAHPDPDDLFELYPQATSETEMHATLTLPLVRRLIEANGGTISAEATSSGLRYTVRLPAYESPSQAAPGHRVNGHRRVLVVDRDPDTAASLRMLLQLQGHDVRIAADRASALPAAQEFHPDTVFIDGSPSNGASEELVKALRLLPETAHAALLCMSTGPAEHGSLYDHCLVKPVEPAVLREVLASSAPVLH